jgi:hypothetical protein
MRVLHRWVEHPLDMPVQGSHEAYAREQFRPVVFSNEQQRSHRGLPFVGIVFGFRERGSDARRRGVSATLFRSAE